MQPETSSDLPRKARDWLRDESGLIAVYVADKTWNTSYGLDAVAYGLFDDQALLQGGVVLHDFDGVTIFFSIALEDNVHLSRADLDLIQRICFDDLGARRMAIRTLASNERALRMARIVGLTYEGTERQAGPNSDDVMRYALLSSERRTFTRSAQQQE